MKDNVRCKDIKMKMKNGKKTEKTNGKGDIKRNKSSFNEREHN